MARETPYASFNFSVEFGDDMIALADPGLPRALIGEQEEAHELDHQGDQDTVQYRDLFIVEHPKRHVDLAENFGLTHHAFVIERDPRGPHRVVGQRIDDGRLLAVGGAILA